MGEMKKSMRENKKYKNSFYVQGSVVRQPEVTPSPQRERQKRAQEEKRYRYHLAVEKERQREFSLGYMAGFVAVVGLSLFVLGDYIKEEATLYMQTREVQILQNTRDNLITENDAAEARLEDDVDLAEIEKIAMEQYGMVYPSEDQLRQFENTEGDYIRQYENIPD